MSRREQILFWQVACTHLLSGEGEQQSRHSANRLRLLTSHREPSLPLLCFSAVSCTLQDRTLGYFSDREEAARAYDWAALCVRGPTKAKTNFPVDDHREDCRLPQMLVDEAELNLAMQAWLVKCFLQFVVCCASREIRSTRFNIFSATDAGQQSALWINASGFQQGKLWTHKCCFQKRSALKTLKTVRTKRQYDQG